MNEKRNIVFRNLILAFVLIVTVIVLIFAWFSNTEKATANGLTVKSYNVGLEAAFVDEDDKYSTKLVDESIKNYPLITGDGTNFFIPSLNRKTGEPITDTSGYWISKRDPVANNDYYEKDIYFRCKEQLQLYLDSTSAVVPKDIQDGTLTNKSDYGDFTKDYIAGAARVAFFDVSTDAEGNESESLKYVWVPNDSYELAESENFIPISKVTESSGFTLSDDPDVTFGLSGLTASGYRMYEASGAQSGDSSISTSATLNSRVATMYRSADNSNLLLGALKVNAKQYYDHGVLISNNGAYLQNFSNFVNQSQNTSVSDTRYNYVNARFDSSCNVGFNGTSYSWAKLSVWPSQATTSFFENYDSFQVLVSYDLTTKTITAKDFVFYNSTSSDIPGGGTIGGTTTEKYVISDEKQVIITSSFSGDAYALTINGDNVSSQSVSFNADGTISSPTTNIVFTAEKGTNDGEYYFKSLLNGKYLSLDSNNNLVLTESKSSVFTLSGSDVPILSSKGKYLTCTSGTFNMGTTPLDLGIFQGSTYKMITDSTNAEVYQFYDTAAHSLTGLSNYKLTSQLDDDDTPSLAILSKSNDDDVYYKAHIRVRIWAEGTDREAKTPLADGIFNNLLDFTGKPLTT
ncbi:MAG: hypothetical protein ACI4G1_05530 [Ruminococcus sp.]